MVMRMEGIRRGMKIGKPGRLPARRTVVYQCAKWHVAGRIHGWRLMCVSVSEVKLFTVHGWGCAGDTRQSMEHV